MSDTIEFEDEADEEAAAYDTPAATDRRRAVREALALDGGETVLSIGPGPGFEPLELADALGPSGRVFGVDRSRAMLALARERLSGRPNAAVARGEATALPVPDGAVDAAVSVQVYQYLDDPTPALAELARVLAPGGRAAVYLADWETFVVRGADPERTARVLASWRDHCADPTLASRLPGLLADVDLTVRAVEPYALAEPDPTGDDFPRHLLDFVADFAAEHEAVGEAEAEGWRESVRGAAARGEAFVSLTGYCYVLGTQPG